MPQLPVVPIENPKATLTKGSLPGSSTKTGQPTQGGPERKAVSEAVGSDSLPGWVNRNASLDNPAPPSIG